MPLVSILMTAYNREAFVADAIASVLAQTLGDFELIVVDDASQDRTVEIANDFAARDRRVRVSVNARNLGQFPNRNHAATLARGAFIKYHDSDDLMYPHCLAVMVPFLNAYPQAGFALGAGGREWSGGPCPMLVTPRMAYQREFLGSGMFHLGPACALFRAEALKRIGEFPLWGVASDYVFWLHACRTENVLLVPGNLFWYRIHPGQELVSPQAQHDYILAAQCGWEALTSSACPLEPQEVEAAKRNWAWSNGRAVLHDLRRGQFNVAGKRWKTSPLTLSEWLRYFRRQRRNPLAGSPTDAHGQFLVPDWAGFERTGAVRGEP